MNKAKIVSGVLSVCVTIPIWLYLWYKIMSMVGANELMWFLFWVYVPVTIVVAILKVVADDL
jgi:hypothetical protein